MCSKRRGVRTSQVSAVRKVGRTSAVAVSLAGPDIDIAASVIVMRTQIGCRMCALHRWARDSNLTLMSRKWYCCNRLGFLVRLIGVARDTTQAVHPQTLPCIQRLVLRVSGSRPLGGLCALPA